MKIYVAYASMCDTFPEHKVEVVTDSQWQNTLISSCHDGLSESIESITSSGHLGKNNRKLLNINFTCVKFQNVYHVYFMFIVPNFLGRDKTFATLHKRYHLVWWDSTSKCTSNIVNHVRWIITKRLTSALMRCSWLKYHVKFGNR